VTTGTPRRSALAGARGDVDVFADAIARIVGTPEAVGRSTSRGVELVSDVLEFPWVYVARSNDPDGNRLQVREGRLDP
jgi:hypothetical protein